MFSLHLKSFHSDNPRFRTYLLYGLVAVGTIALILGRMTETLADPDLWGYLTFGRLYWNNDGFPYHDPYAYTPIKAFWIYHEWLTGVLFHSLYEYLGSFGLQGLKYITGLATAFAIYKTARTRLASGEASVACLILISPLFSFAYSPVRAQVFTNLFFALTLYILERTGCENRSRHIWCLIPMYLLWSNLHGGVVAGLGIIGLYAAGKALAGKKSLPYWLVLAAAVAVTLINPYGLEYWLYLKDALFMPRPDIDEWHSVFTALRSGESTANHLVFLLFFFLTGLLLASMRNRRITDILILSATSLMAFQHVRHESLFFIAMGCYGPCYFTQAWDIMKKSSGRAEFWSNSVRRIAPVLFLVLLIVFGTRFVTGHPFDLTLRSPNKEKAVDFNYPTGAVNFIRNNTLKGNILTEFSWGEFIIWNLPESRIAMDGRYETLYTEEATREYFRFTKGETGWRDYLRKYRHDLILFRPDSVVNDMLSRDPDWVKIYADADCILFIRRKIPS
jgi:hypothetical protein